MKGAALAAAVVLPGGLILVTGTLYTRLFLAAKTGNPNLDRLGIRGNVVTHALAIFGPTVSVDIVRRLMAIVNNESGGKPENYLGDATLSAGPSIGPMQVYRKTARELGLVPDDISAEDYAALSTKEFRTIGMGVRVFKQKLEDAGGDLDDAVRRYNGSGDAAEAYRDKALSFVSSTWSSSEAA